MNRDTLLSALEQHNIPKFSHSWEDYTYCKNTIYPELKDDIDSILDYEFFISIIVEYLGL